MNGNILGILLYLLIGFMLIGLMLLSWEVIELIEKRIKKVKNYERA